MSEFHLQPGLTNEITRVVAPEEGTGHTGGVSVFSTPSMLMRMEECCLTAVQPLLPEGFSTVGVTVNITHMAATPVGDTVTTKCKLLEVNGSKLLFEVACFDSKRQVGKGTHGRAVIDARKFASK